MRRLYFYSFHMESEIRAAFFCKNLKPSLAKLLSRIPHADRLLEHIVASHTTHIDVGKVAKAAGVKTLVLNHFVPVDDPSLTEEMWIEGAKMHFDGKIIVGKDLMEI